MALLDEIATRLSSQSVGGLPATTAATGTGWTLYYSELQHSPDQSIAIVPSGGFDAIVWSSSRSAGIDRPTFQVLVRGKATGSSAVMDKCSSVISVLDCYDGTRGGYVYSDVRKTSDLLYLGRDENHRPVYSLNFVAMRSRDT